MTKEFATAAVPIESSTVITTTDQGLVCGDVEIEIDGFLLPAYRDVESGKANAPVVIVIPEIFGLHEHIADVVRRLAHCGYMAIAPDVMARHGDATTYENIEVLRSELVSKILDTQVLADLDLVIDWAGTQGGDLSRVGMTGFCWGGRITWLYAAHQGRAKAAVAWYGRLSGYTSANAPYNPVDIARELQTPVLGLYGEADTGISMDTVKDMQTRLADGTESSKASGFIIYPDAPHAFYADYRPTYRPEPAKAAWQEMLNWFERNGL